MRSLKEIINWPPTKKKTILWWLQIVQTRWTQLPGIQAVQGLRWERGWAGHVEACWVFGVLAWVDRLPQCCPVGRLTETFCDTRSLVWCFTVYFMLTKLCVRYCFSLYKYNPNTRVGPCVCWSRNMDLSVPDLQVLFSPLCWADDSNVSAKLIRRAPPVGGLRDLCVWEVGGGVQMGEGFGREGGREWRRKPVSFSRSGLCLSCRLQLPPPTQKWPSFSPPLKIAAAYK